MAELKHTPGPWRTMDATSFGVPYIITDNKITIAQSYEGYTAEETEANAKLIAAAPELLDALQTGAMTLAEKLKRLGADDPNVSPTYRKMIAAIEKATLTSPTNAE